jgi:glycine betaine/proline transport system permease protein
VTVAAAPTGSIAEARGDSPTAVWARRVAVPVLAIVAIVAVGYAIGHDVPTWLDAHVKPEVDKAYHWTVLNNDKHWIFTGFFTPIGDAIQWSTDHMLSLLRILRWPGVLALTAVVGYRTGGLRTALTGAIVLSGCGFLGFWDHTMITLALMLVSVVVSLLIGIPLGIWSGLSPRAEKVMRSILDTAQVMPTYVYLLPIIVAFSIKSPAAVIATVIYAVPPAVRLTSLGIRSVAGTNVEVGESFGCTPRQLLLKVRLPLARRPILLGVNQVIMMAFGVVVIAAVVGTGGAGQDVLDGLAKIDVGKAFGPGLALVFAAIAIDRVTTGQRGRDHRRRFGPWTGAAIGLGAIVAIAIIAKVIGTDHFPESWKVDVSGWANSAADWVQRNFRKGVPIVGGTASFSDFFVIHILDPVRDLLQDAAWYVVIAVVAVIAWLSAGWRLATVCTLCMIGIASLRVWDLAMETLSQILIITVIAVALAIPIGVCAARSDLVERILRPLLDAAQVLPAFVYLVPVLFLFNIGRVPGVIATIIYALPPAIRLLSLGLREVPWAPREAAISFGATPRQELTKVQIPLALRSVMLAVNQVIIMVLAMLVIGALLGAGGLGLETIYGVRKKEVGRGFAGGIAIVLLAIVLDRITQAWGNRDRTRRRPAH